jgi:hypothetical protein
MIRKGNYIWNQKMWVVEKKMIMIINFQLLSSHFINLQLSCHIYLLVINFTNFKISLIFHILYHYKNFATHHNSSLYNSHIKLNRQKLAEGLHNTSRLNSL